MVLCCLVECSYLNLNPHFYECNLPLLIAADISGHQSVSVAIYFGGFVHNPPVCHSAVVLCFSPAATVSTVYAQYYMGCSDWLKLLTIFCLWCSDWPKVLTILYTYIWCPEWLKLLTTLYVMFWLVEAAQVIDNMELSDLWGCGMCVCVHACFCACK